MARARKERDDAERAVAERSVAFRQEQRQVRFGFEEMKLALPAKSAVVGFVRYGQHQFGKPSSGGTQPPAAYLAFITRAGQTAASLAIVALWIGDRHRQRHRALAQADGVDSGGRGRIGSDRRRSCRAPGRSAAARQSLGIR